MSGLRNLLSFGAGYSRKCTSQAPVLYDCSYMEGYTYADKDASYVQLSSDQLIFSLIPLSVVAIFSKITSIQSLIEVCDATPKKHSGETAFVEI